MDEEEVVRRLIEREIGWNLEVFKQYSPEEQARVLVGLAEKMIPMLQWFRKFAAILLKDETLNGRG